MDVLIAQDSYPKSPGPAWGQTTIKKVGFWKLNIPVGPGRSYVGYRLPTPITAPIALRVFQGVPSASQNELLLGPDLPEDCKIIFDKPQKVKAIQIRHLEAGDTAQIGVRDKTRYFYGEIVVSTTEIAVEWGFAPKELVSLLK